MKGWIKEVKSRIVWRWGVSLFLSALAALHLGAAVYYWFYRGNTWFLGPIKIRLHQWEKPWLIGIALWSLAVFIRPSSFLPRSWVRPLFWPGGGGERVRDSFVRWMVFGVAVGVGIGFYYTWLRHYQFPTFLHALPVILALAAAGGVVHAFWALICSAASNRVFSSAEEEYHAGLRSGLYFLLCLLLVYGPLRRWEGRFYDPLWPLGVGCVVALIFCWLWLAPGRVAILSAKFRWGTRLILIVLLLMVGAASTVAHYRRLHPSTSPRQRVVLITLDTTRADHLSCYGYYRPTSPHLDRYAAAGVRFHMAICALDSTDPSHTSMFTGAYPRSHGVIDNTRPISGPVSSLPLYFHDRGFLTAAIASRAELSPSYNLRLPGFSYESVPGRRGIEASAPAAFRRAADWLSRHRDENIFIWIHFFDPHHPYDPHPGFAVNFGGHTSSCRMKKTWLPMDEYLLPEVVEKCVDLYDTEIAFMDYWVGRTVSWIEQLEPRPKEGTIFVFLADHGENLGEYQHHPIHLGFGHGGLLYNSTFRIPFIFYSPGIIPEGVVVEEVVETVDLAPTLVELVFGKSDFKCQGESLVPFFQGTGKSDNLGFAQRFRADDIPERPMLALPQYAVFRYPWKLITGPDGTQELYNLAQDPGEKENLALDQSEEVKALIHELEEWLVRTPEVKPVEPILDRSHRDILRALGYIQ